MHVSNVCMYGSNVYSLYIVADLANNTRVQPVYIPYSLVMNQRNDMTPSSTGPMHNIMMSDPNRRIDVLGLCYRYIAESITCDQLICRTFFHWPQQLHTKLFSCMQLTLTKKPMHAQISMYVRPAKFHG